MHLNRVRFVSARLLALAAIFTCASILSRGQTAQPSKSFVFTMTAQPVSLDTTLLGKLEAGSVNCSDIVQVLRGVGITLDRKGSTGYIVQFFQFQATDASQKRSDWYSFDSSWYKPAESEKPAGCHFSPYPQFLSDVTSAKRFKDLRLWGRTDLEMVAIFDVSASKPLEVVFSSDPNRKAIEGALASASKASPPALDGLCNFAHTGTKDLPKADAACASRVGGRFQEISSDVVNEIAGYLGKTYGRAPIPWATVVPQLDGRDVTAASNPGGPWGLTSDCKDSNLHCAMASAAYGAINGAIIKYQWDVTKTTPTPLQNLAAALSQGGSLAAAQAAGPIKIPIDLAPLQSLVLYGAKGQQIDLLPSSLKVTGTVPAPKAVGGDQTGQKPSDISLGSATLQNEQKYFWNVSVAAPLKAVSSVTYDQSTLSPKTLDNKAAYAAFDVYLGKVDTSNTKVRLVPAIFGGPSFTGKFLDRWLVGASIGVYFVEPFWGYSFLGSEVPVNPADASKGTRRQWHHYPVWGINIPIRSFYKLASNNSSKSTSTGGSKTKSQ